MSSPVSSRLFPAAEIWGQSDAAVQRSESSRQLGDEALMACVQAGDEAALGQLLDRYARLVLGIGFRILRDFGEAQELVQDVFLHVYRKAHLFDPQRGTFRMWFTQVVCHRALNRREYLNLHHFYDSRNLEDFADVFPAATDLDYEADLGRSEQALAKAFKSLNEKQRATLRLYFFEGYTLREISMQLNESLANVRHYYYRALERLKVSKELDSFKGQ